MFHLITLEEHKQLHGYTRLTENIIQKFPSNAITGFPEVYKWMTYSPMHSHFFSTVFDK